MSMRDGIQQLGINSTDLYFQFVNAWLSSLLWLLHTEILCQYDISNLPLSAQNLLSFQFSLLPHVFLSLSDRQQSLILPCSSSLSIHFGLISSSSSDRIRDWSPSVSNYASPSAPTHHKHPTISSKLAFLTFSPRIRSTAEERKTSPYCGLVPFLSQLGPQQSLDIVLSCSLNSYSKHLLWSSSP